MISSRRVGLVSFVAATVCVAAVAFGQLRVSSEKDSAVRGADPGRSIDARVTAVAPSVSTDLADYAPGDTVVITGSGFDANDTITLLVAHADGTPVGGAGHDPFAAISDEGGSFSATWYVDPDDSGESTFLLTADCAHGLHAETTFTDTVPGHGVVTSVTANDGGCVAVSATTALTFWDVQPGKTYTITISGVDDAANGGTDPTIPLFIQNVTIGNSCLVGQQVAVGVYALRLTIPLNACITSTINYGVCDVVTAKRARGNAADANPATSTNGVHYRANTNCTASGVVSCSATGACCDGTTCAVRMISNCVNQGGVYQGTGVPCTPTTCTPPGCDVFCPQSLTVDCSASTEPADTGFATCSDGCVASYSDRVEGGTCPQESTITRTWTCTGTDGSTATCDQIIRVVDTTPPVVTCPEDCEVECGDVVCAPPLCDDAGCVCGGTASCTDDCGDCSVQQSCEFVPTGCEVSVVAGVTPPPKTGTLFKTFSSSDAAATVAGGGCPNVGTCTQTIRIVDTRAPAVIVCPGDLTIDCSETPVFGEPVCEDTCDTCYVEVVGDDVVSEGACTQEYSVTRCWVAVDTCGNRSEPCCQTITVQDTTPPVVTCPEDCEIECGQTACVGSDCDGAACSCGGEATCTDDCGDCSINSTCEFFPGSCESVVAGVTPPPKTGTLVRTFSSSDGVSTVADAGCPNTASCAQSIRIVDTIEPEITCSGNVTVRHDAGQCCATVNYSTSATDSCDETPSVDCTNASGTCFNVGTTSVRCTATDDCSNEDGCSFTVTVKTSICGRKTYDRNADGNTTGDLGIRGFKVVLSGAANRTLYTDSTGAYCFNDLLPGTYTVQEIMPCGNWVNTTPLSCSFPNMTCPQTCAFSNVCLGEGGGHSKGYWSCKNGSGDMNDGGSATSELALLSSLNLRNSSGGHFNPTTVSSFQTWLSSASATNMAYMLSAQLAAMQLNVEKGYVSGTRLIHAPGCGEFMTVTALMSAANTALGNDGYTPSGDPNRAGQECLKNVLDRGNNDRNFVKNEACSISHY